MGWWKVEYLKMLKWLTCGCSNHCGVILVLFMIRDAHLLYFCDTRVNIGVQCRCCPLQRSMFRIWSGRFIKNTLYYLTRMPDTIRFAEKYPRRDVICPHLTDCVQWLIPQFPAIPPLHLSVAQRRWTVRVLLNNRGCPDCKNQLISHYNIHCISYIPRNSIISKYIPRA